MTMQINGNKLAEIKLGISSDCVHFITPSGAIATDTHIFFRQIEAIAAYFKEVVICCPFAEFDPALSYSIYQHKKIRFIPSPHVGGDKISDKLVLLKTIPQWLRLFRKLDKETDIVYQRFPNNLNIPGFFYFYLRRKKVFATFTGSWDKDPVASFSTRFQQFLLQHFFRGPVWVYTNQKNLPMHIYSSFSPSYTYEEWLEESAFIEKRIAGLKGDGSKVLKMISVGTLCERKNHIHILRCCVKLKETGIPFYLRIAGSGEKLEAYQNFIYNNDLQDCVELCGSVHFNQLKQYYRDSDLVVQSPTSEPYGKVPIEGFFYGAIPVLSSSSIMAEAMTENGKRGFVFDLSSESFLVDILVNFYVKLTVSIKESMIKQGRDFVRNITIDAWANEYAEVLKEYIS